MGRERPTLRVESEGKVALVLRAERSESRGGGGGCGRRRWREAAVGGAASGPGRRLGSRPGAQLRPALPGSRPAASAARCLTQRGLVLARNFHSGKRADDERRGRRLHPAGAVDARPRSPALPSPGAGSPPSARVRGALSRPWRGTLARVPPATGPQRLTNNKQK